MSKDFAQLIQDEMDRLEKIYPELKSLDEQEELQRVTALNK